MVVMEPQFPLEGRVTAPDGRPVESFTVDAGPKRLPKSYEDVKRDVKDGAGRFVLGLDEPGLHWVGVRAEGYAAWEGWVEVARGGKPIDVRLEPGVTASARVVAPMRGGGPIRAQLVPRRDKSDFGGMNADLSEEFAARTASVAPDGALRFEHLRPDRYILRLDGPTITPIRLAVDVPAGGLDLGAIRLAGRGRVVGRVFLPPDDKGGGRPWEFVSGVVYSRALDGHREIEFKSDEDGRFAFDGVPAGLARVGFTYMVFDVQRGPHLVDAGRRGPHDRGPRLGTRARAAPRDPVRGRRRVRSPIRGGDRSGRETARGERHGTERTHLRREGSDDEGFAPRADVSPGVDPGRSGAALLLRAGVGTARRAGKSSCRTSPRASTASACSTGSGAPT